jgi:hypothetical protein
MIVQRGFSFHIFKIVGQSAKLLHGATPTVYHSQVFPYHGHGASSPEEGQVSNSAETGTANDQATRFGPESENLQRIAESLRYAGFYGLLDRMKDRPPDLERS